jgi:hypothetical protein
VVADKRDEVSQHMTRVIVGGDWRYADQVDGKDIVDGEILLVRFPDGFEMYCKALVTTSTLPIKDHGHSYDSSRKQAYATTDFHGSTSLVRLVGLEATRFTP